MDRYAFTNLCYPVSDVSYLSLPFPPNRNTVSLTCDPFLYICAFEHGTREQSTDNVALLLSYFTRQNNLDSGEIREYLGIGEEFEDIC